jgi:hypothetical protein
VAVFVTEQSPHPEATALNTEQVALARRIDRSARLGVVLLRISLQNVETWTFSAMPQEEDITRLQEALDRVWRGLQRVFLVSRTGPSPASSLETIRQKYWNARGVLGSTSCLISRVPDPDYQNTVAQMHVVRDGGAERPPRGKRYGIQLGRYFFNGPDANTEDSRAIQHCSGPHSGVDRWRIAALLHEAVHWVNVDERRDRNLQGIHTSVGALHNPFHYQFFVIEFYCRTPADSWIEVYRREYATLVGRRPTGAVRLPGSRGGFRSRRPLGYA